MQRNRCASAFARIASVFFATSLAACAGGGSTPGSVSISPALSQPQARAGPHAQSIASLGTTSVDLFSDDFSAGTLAGWSIASGAWSVTNVSPAPAGVSAPAAPAAMFAGDATWSDYHVETTVRPATPVGVRGFSMLVGRAVDTTHGYAFGFVNERTGNRWSLWRDDSGTLRPLARAAFPFVDGQPYRLRIDFARSTITVAIATGTGAYATVASVVDATYASGRIGLATIGAATSSFTDVRAWTGPLDEASPAPSPSTGPSPSPAPSPYASPTASPGSGSAYIAPAGTQPFPSGPFDLPVSAPVDDPNSATYLSHALAGTTHALGKLQFATNLTGPTDSNVPVYVAHNADPHYTIHCAYYSNCPLEGADVAIPARAIPAGRLGYATFTDDGTHDQHLAVRNLDTDVESDMWLTPQPGGSGGALTIGYGGQFPIVGSGVGHAGATAAGFALSLGRVRAIDLLAGHIPTALFLVTPCENGHVAPATGDDGGTTAGCPPIGAHVWLDSSPADIAASGATADVRVILNAMHEFGGYIGDRCTSCTLGIALEGGLAYEAFGLTDPWLAIAALHPGEVASAPPGGVAEYHIAVASGTIDLGTHLHVIR